MGIFLNIFTVDLWRNFFFSIFWTLQSRPLPTRTITPTCLVKAFRNTHSSLIRHHMNVSTWQYNSSIIHNTITHKRNCTLHSNPHRFYYSMLCILGALLRSLSFLAATIASCLSKCQTTNIYRSTADHDIYTDLDLSVLYLDTLLNSLNFLR